MTVDMTLEQRLHMARAVARTAFDRWLAVSVVLLLWCLPAGVVALVLLRGGYKSITAGDFPGAVARYRAVKVWVTIGFVLMGIVWLWAAVSALSSMSDLGGTP